MWNYVCHQNPNRSFFLNISFGLYWRSLFVRCPLVPYEFQLNSNLSYQNYDNLSCSVSVGFSQKDWNLLRIFPKTFHFNVLSLNDVTAQEASWERGFDSFYTLLFDLYCYLRTNVHFLFVPIRVSRGWYPLVFSGRFRHPLDSLGNSADILMSFKFKRHLNTHKFLIRHTNTY